VANGDIAVIVPRSRTPVHPGTASATDQFHHGSWKPRALDGDVRRGAVDLAEVVEAAKKLGQRTFE
jgi:hypothetical protein